MKNIHFLLFCCLIGWQSGLAQTIEPSLNCASTLAMQEFYRNHPDLRPEAESQDPATAAGRSNPATLPVPPYVLPVVVHLIHQNGAENISDEQVEAGIARMNEAFANSGAYGTLGEGFDTQIQFCLAQRDPEGNPSTGITRHVSPLTDMIIETQDVAMKDIARWDPFSYINVYVVREISSISLGNGVLGYAFFPTSHGMAEDGIVIEAPYVSASSTDNVVLAHEMGHYLDLFHTFEGGCPNDDCTASGDRVCDTPPDQGTYTGCNSNTCSTDLDDSSPNNPLTADEDDPTENFMDYSPFDCYYAFTPGQADRMYSAIETIRFSLLESDGCRPVCPNPMTINFTASDQEIFAGETVDFTNNSIGALAYEWAVDGVPFATTENSSFEFPNAGTFEVELTIENDDPECAESLTITIEVLCAVEASFLPDAGTPIADASFTITNTSTNAFDFEWYVNGVLVSTMEDLDFVFPNGGIYTILLIAFGTGCLEETSQQLTVLPSDPTNPCGDPPCVEICGNGIDDDGDGYVDCFDVDCECSDGNDCGIEIPPNNFDSSLEWFTPDDRASSISMPLVANMDPQNGSMPEIIVAKGDQNFFLNPTTTMLFYSGDGSNQDNPVELEIEGQIPITPGPHPAIGDVNGDGTPELVVVCWDSLVRVYSNYDPNANPAMTLIATSEGKVIDPNATPSLADFNSDGIAEVLVANDVFQFDFSGVNPQLTKALDGDGDYGKIGWAFDFDGTNGCSQSVAVDILTVADCAGNPDCNGLEIVAGTNIYSVDLDPNDGDGIEITIQRDLNEINPGQRFIDGFTSTADVNLDGFLDVIVASSRDFEMGVYVWDKNGLINFMPFPDPPPGEQHIFIGVAAIANVYDDTVDGYAQDLPEIICVSSFQLTAFNLNVAAANPAQPYHWSIFTDDSSGFTGVSIFDFNGDGINEICYRETELLRIMYGGAQPFPPGVDGDRNWNSRIIFSPTGGEAPVIADCDGDGEAEIICTGRISPQGVFANTESRLWVVGSGESPWLPARPIWNQYGYFGVNINDDLSIPTNQQAHQLEFPEVGSGNRPFNQFMAQLPTLDADFTNFFPVPDAVVTIDSSQCEGDSIRFWFTLCNEGAVDLPAGLPIVFYEGDPTTAAVDLLGTPLFLSDILEPGNCLANEVAVPAVYDVVIYTVANADPGLSTPFPSTLDFGEDGVVECDYNNNLADFTIFSGVDTPPDLGPDISLCNSSVSVLDPGVDFDSYLWPDGSTERTFTAFSPGIYWITVQNECGPVLTDTIEIILDEAAGFELGEDLSVCAGQSLELSVDGFESVRWSSPSDLDCTDCPTINVAPTSPTIYYATAQNGDCVFTDSIRVLIDEVALSLTADTLDCNQSTGQVSVSTNIEGLDFSWSGPNGFTATGETVMVSSPGAYSVTATSPSGGCETIASLTVSADEDLPQAIINPPNNTIGCEAGSLSLDASPSSQGDAFTYSWSPAQNIATGANTLTPQITEAGSYVLTVINQENGCSASSEVSVTNSEAPEILDFLIEPTGCNDLNIGAIELLEVVGTGSNFSYSINGSTSTSSPRFENLAAGTYSVEVVDEAGCSTNLELEVSEPSGFSINIIGDTVVGTGIPFRLTTVVNPPETEISNILWSPGNFSQDLSIEPTVFAETNFSVIVTDVNGCVATDDVLVRLRNSIYFPNAIHPNSPFSENRILTGFGPSSTARIQSLQVFDRWGGFIYDGRNLLPNDTSTGWDGTARGQPVDTGVYLYTAVVEFPDGEVLRISGDVLVMR